MHPIDKRNGRRSKMFSFFTAAHGWEHTVGGMQEDRRGTRLMPWPGGRPATDHPPRRHLYLDLRKYQGGCILRTEPPPLLLLTDGGASQFQITSKGGLFRVRFFCTLGVTG